MQKEIMSGLPNVVVQQKIDLTLPYFPEMLPFLLTKYHRHGLTVYEGFDNCAWNAGRTKTKNLELTEEVIKKFNDLGIKIASTFSNNKIDTQDEVGNRILKLLDNGLLKNEIILSNEKLRCYIRENHDLSLKFSITGHTNITEFYNDRVWDKAGVFMYYLDLFQKYDTVVLHSELAIKRWFLDFLKKFNLLDRAEVIMNIINGCSMCPKHKEHYELVSAVNRGDLINDGVMGCILENPKDGFVDGYYNARTQAFLVKTFKKVKLEGRTQKSFKIFMDLYQSEIDLLRLKR